MDTKKHICPVPWHHMEVGYDHNVFLCCHIPTPVGNLAHNSVEEIWKGKKAEEVRASILDGSYSFCNHTTCPILNQPLEISTHEWWQHTLALFPQDIASAKANGNWAVSIAPWPRRVSLANDKLCNLACESCRNEHILSESNLDLDLVLRKLLNSGILAWAEVLKLNGAGEFIRSPKLLDFMKTALGRHPGLRLELLSNLTTFNAEMFYHLGLRGRVKQIWGSIDAATPETYAKVRGSNYRAVMQRLDSFVNIQRDENLRIIMGFVVSSLNFLEMPAFASMAASRGIEAEFMGIQHWGHLPDARYKELDITNETHPRHEEFLRVMQGTRFLQRHVRLGNLLRFVKL